MPPDDDDVLLKSGEAAQRSGRMGKRTLGRHYHSTHIHEHIGHVTGADVRVRPALAKIRLNY